MKIRCDVCDKEEATVFCSADEAALCDVCDCQIHHANKLARKHKRFSLLHPTFKDSPRCDICQERRGFLFCQEDRAILCRECDHSIHKSNEHTQKHSRFLLPGVKLSAASSLYPTSLACSNFPEVMTAKINDARASKSSTKRQRTVSPNKILSSPSPSLLEQTISSSSDKKVEENYCFNDNGSGSTSSISKYLMEKLPGGMWKTLIFHMIIPMLSLSEARSSKQHKFVFSSDDLAIWVLEVSLVIGNFLANGFTLSRRFATLDIVGEVFPTNLRA